MITNDNSGPYSPGQFAMMDHKEHADIATTRATDASKSARSPKGHAKAAALHKEAAKAHSAAGNKDEAKFHRDKAKEHTAKAGGATANSKGGPTVNVLTLNKDQLLEGLVNNGYIDKADLPLVGKWPLEKLRKIAHGVFNVKKKMDSSDEDSDLDDDDDDSSSYDSSVANDGSDLHSFDKLIGGSSTGGGKGRDLTKQGDAQKNQPYTGNRAKELAAFEKNMPLAAKEVWNAAKDADANKRARLLVVLTTNLAADPDARKRKAKHLNNSKTTEQLEEMVGCMGLIGNSENPAQPDDLVILNFTGAAGGIGGVNQAPVTNLDAKDVIPEQRMEFSFDDNANPKALALLGVANKRAAAAGS